MLCQYYAYSVKKNPRSCDCFKIITKLNETSALSVISYHCQKINVVTMTTEKPNTQTSSHRASE